MVILIIILAFLLLFIAGVSKAIMDKVNFHFSESIFIKYNGQFWNPVYSSLNKYKDGMKKADYYIASDIWKVLVQKAWDNGEPGIIFDDELNRGDIFRGKFGKLLVNPCVT